MTVHAMTESLGLEVLCMPAPEKIPHGVYAGDLLSWVMGRAEEDNLWVTIMTNVNVVAVASLVGMSAVILCDGSEIGEDVVQTAKEKGVNLLRTPRPMYETCLSLSGLSL